MEERVLHSELAKTLKGKAGAVVAVVQGDATEVIMLGRDVDASTPMEIGSLTKGFTGLLLAEMLQRGEVALEARVDHALGEAWPDEPITLLDLATHMSGLPKLSVLPQVGLLGDPYRKLDREHVLRWLKQRQPHLAGERAFGYSNLGFAVLGLVLENATGVAYKALLRERVLEPMGLNATRLQMSDGPTLVRGGFSMLGLRAKPWHFQAYAPCGALVSTADDLLKAVRLWIDAKGTQAETVETAVRPRRQVPRGSIGLAWITPEGGQWHWHNGATFGYASYLGFSRASQCGVVVLTNQFSAQAPTELGNALMQQLIAPA
jgi:CubicO group peptidase (beta-lactamase class C family)